LESKLVAQPTWTAHPPLIEKWSAEDVMASQTSMSEHVFQLASFQRIPHCAKEMMEEKEIDGRVD
jgi:hypothetical protein